MILDRIQVNIVIRIIYRIHNKITKSKEKQQQPQLDKGSNTEYTVEKIIADSVEKLTHQCKSYCTLCGMRLHIPPSAIMKACPKSPLSNE